MMRKKTALLSPFFLIFQAERACKGVPVEIAQF